jgi:hypothetical protein
MEHIAGHVGQNGPTVAGLPVRPSALIRHLRTVLPLAAFWAVEPLGCTSLRPETWT